MDILTHCTVFGPALPEPFVRYELERELTRLGLLPKNSGVEGKRLAEFWTGYRRKLRELVAYGGSIRVHNHVIEPLWPCLGYDRCEAADAVQTREGAEPGGMLLISVDGSAQLRTWSVDFEVDLDAPFKRGAAYRYSHQRIAQRVLLAAGERVGLLTNGTELRLLLVDPARPDSHLVVPIESHWKTTRDVPDSLRLLLALASPKGTRAVPELVEKARLQQSRVTRELRTQARQAVQWFIQEILDHPDNRDWANRFSSSGFPEQGDHELSNPEPSASTLVSSPSGPEWLAKQLWREGLITVYRMLFIFKLESTDDIAQSFGFASTSLWRNTFSPSVALAPFVEDVLNGEETGRLLEDGLRTVFRMFAEGLHCTELNVKPLGGALFGRLTTPILDGLRWGERAVAKLLSQLLWTPLRRGSTARERVHYGPLDVEDLGRVYEALLELEPGIAAEPMCRLRRQKLEVVVPIAQGEKYRPATGMPVSPELDGDEDVSDATGDEAEDDGGKKTKVEWVEEIPAGRFFLRVGLGRKATGSYYTPHSFVRFLVQETLGVQVTERSPNDDPQPGEILKLKVLDPAMGSGHFLVEACRFLGEKLYEASRLCDELATEADLKAEKTSDLAEAEKLRARSRAFRQRVADLPDPEDELLRYLPSRSAEGLESGISQRIAQALCRRLVTVHCLYGVDRNLLAVELAKLSLWLESHAEGMPLTFLDHRLVVGDSLTGPSFEHLLTWPSTQQPIDDLFVSGLRQSFLDELRAALRLVNQLEATVGSSLSEIEAKATAKAQLDAALEPFKLVAAAWAGGVMLGSDQCDDVGYGKLIELVGKEKLEAEGWELKLAELLETHPQLNSMIARGLGLIVRQGDKKISTPEHPLSSLNFSTPIPALSYELTFPEVFYPEGNLANHQGFDAVLGNPPWEGIDTSDDEFFAGIDFSIMELTSSEERRLLISNLLETPVVSKARSEYESIIESYKRIAKTYFSYVGVSASGASAATPDLYQCFAEKQFILTRQKGMVGVVLPSGFHANQSAFGLRDLYLNKMTLVSCFSFENIKQFFEIDSRVKFAILLARKSNRTNNFSCAFYLHDEHFLFQKDKGNRLLNYTLDFLRYSTGNSLNFLELRSTEVVPIIEAIYRSKQTTFGELRKSWSILTSEELHTSKQKHKAKVLNQLYSEVHGDPRQPEMLQKLNANGIFLICKGENFHQFTTSWGNPPGIGTTISEMVDKFEKLKAACFFRLVFRRQASSTNERTLITTLSQPGILYFDSALPEKEPFKRPTWKPIFTIALSNSFTFDWIVRQLVAANVTFNFLDTIPVPTINQIAVFVSHLSNRLICNHAGFAPLWLEQLGEVWRETSPPFSWPVLAGDDARWQVRAAIDAVVAQAYGLNRDQYAHVLSTFSHKSYPAAPGLCLERFDELIAVGLETFTRYHDPYWDISLNESLPVPVISLPEFPTGVDSDSTPTMPKRKGKKRPAPEVSLPFSDEDGTE